MFLDKSTFVQRSRGLSDSFRGGWPLCHGVTEAKVVTSIPFVHFISITLFDERPNNKGNYNRGRVTGKIREKGNVRMSRSHHKVELKAWTIIVIEKNMLVIEFEISQW